MSLILLSAVCMLADPSRLGAEDFSAHQNTFSFKTDQMQGEVRLDGPYHGVSKLVDRRTGTQVIDSRYSALNLFKLMSVNQIMGQPRRMERTISRGEDWVELTWPATESHLAEITARYEVATPTAVDLTVTVKSKGSYRGYELFLSNYFNKRFRPYVYLWTRSRRERELVMPTLSDVFRETVLVFPRDAHAARHCVDGRWERSEFKTPVVQMCPVRHYAHSLAIMADKDNKLAVVLMSKPSDCYAISTRYHADNEADRLTDYSAFDLSLFGDDLRPLAKRTVKVRLALTEIDAPMSQPLKLYREYIADSKANSKE